MSPYAKDPSAYPPEFQELYRRALIEHTSIECEYPQQATSLRHQLHAFRRAVEAAKIPGWSEMRNISILIEGKTLTLRNNSELLSRIRAASGSSSQPSDADLDKYLKDMETGDKS